MPSVDNRVVRMEFDNATFQTKVAATIKSLGDLDKALKLDGAHKGLSDISKAASSVNLGPVQTAVQSVSSSFLALSTIAVTALATITRAAISSGSQMLSAFTFKPIFDGFSEFETNVRSIQTILSNTRADNTGLADVNAALDKLNEFSDKTIFNFGEMARNIGTFTAAGVDLQTSVDSIKGIANLAAISGSSSEQAATAMYQLSQAIATGTVRLMDWNSVVNAGMGGEVFQRALFESGKALKTINDVPINTTFEEWTAAGNSFRDSLQDGWLTGEVLTTTLKGISGEMTAAELQAKGFTQDQITALLELGEVGLEAATKIRTFSQLMTTVKETIGSGWSRTFRTVIGDFEESTELFTNINNAISGFVNKQADARNELLQGWKDMGGRTLLVQGLSDAFKALADIVRPIRDAFRDIFPPATAQSLFNITKSFAEFAKSLKPSQQTIENIGRIFKGLFSILDIGWEVIKSGVGFLKDLVLQITGLGSGRLLEFTADIADFFTALRDGLDQGDAIGRFFDNLLESLQGPIRFLKDAKDAIVDFFESLGGDAVDAAGAGVDRVTTRFGSFQGVLEKFESVGERVKSVLEAVGRVLDTVGQAIIDWFQELGQKLADAIGPGEFNEVIDALNVSLLGGIALLLKRFLSGGINLDFGDGLFDSIKDSFHELTGVLDALQTQIRADALLKIATAVGILAASMVVLSLIDSAALTKALVAMSVGFGQLMASFAILNTLDAGVLDGATFAAIATGMIIFAGALVILAGAVAILAQLDMGELARGLGAVIVLTGTMVGTAILLSRFSGSMIAAGIGIAAMAIALNILAGAVALFATMEWDTLIRGFAGVAAGLLIIAGAMHLMPSGLQMITASAGLLLVSIALNALGAALKIFASMEWSELARGLAGVAGGLLIIAAAMHLMPSGLQMITAAAGLVLVGIALNAIGAAMKIFGSMSWSEIAHGLAALAGSLLILAVATNAMTGALAGAAAVLVVSIALGVLAKVLKEVADIPFGDLIKAIGGIAIALAVFGIAAALLQPVIPALLGLGVALLALGAAFALFGVGALAVAKAFEILAETGPAAADALVAAMEAIGRGIPALIAGFAQGIVELIQVFTDAAPVIAEALGVLLLHISDTIIAFLPKFKELIIGLIDLFLDVVVEKSPEVIEAGFQLLLNFLNGINNHIAEIVTVVSSIIVNFLNALAANMQQIIDAGTNLLVQFLLGITNNLVKILETVGTIVTTFINGMAGQASRIVTAGANALISFLSGIANNISKVITAGVEIVIALMNSISDNAIKLAEAAFDCVITFLNELAAVIREKSGELRQAGINIAVAIADGITGGLASKAKSIADKAVGVAGGALDAVTGFLGIGSPSKKFIAIGEWMGEGMVIGMDNSVHTVERSSERLANVAVSSFQGILSRMSDEIGAIEDFSPTITPVLDLTGATGDLQRFQGYIRDLTPLVPTNSFIQAQQIAVSPTPRQSALDADSTTTARDVKFEQNIYAPDPLSSAQIYKQTRNQLTVAKEELNVP